MTLDRRIAFSIGCTFVLALGSVLAANAETPAQIIKGRVSNDVYSPGGRARGRGSSQPLKLTAAFTSAEGPTPESIIVSSSISDSTSHFISGHENCSDCEALTKWSQWYKAVWSEAWQKRQKLSKEATASLRITVSLDANGLPVFTATCTAPHNGYESDQLIATVASLSGKKELIFPTKTKEPFVKMELVMKEGNLLHLRQLQQEVCP